MPETPDASSSEPAEPAIAETSFDDVAKLFTSTSPSGLASGPLQLIHEGEDLLGHPDEHTSQDAQPIRTPSASSGFSPFPGGAEDVSPAGFHASFLDGLTNEAPPAAAPPPEAAPEKEEAAPLPIVEQAPSPPPRVAEKAPVVAPAAPADAPAIPEPPAAPSREASAAFVTETMAELYLQQGHREQALEVYRKLVRLQPNDANLGARLRALESAQAEELHGVPAISEPEVVADTGPTIREFLGLIADFRPRGTRAPDDLGSHSEVSDESSAAAPPPSSTVGGSIHNLFADAEQRGTADQNDQPRHEANDRAAPEPPLPGRPSTPAASELSLDHVFRHATPATGSGGQSGFSFDQFFSQQAQQDVAATEAEPSNEGGAGQADDIQQFNAWLEGLKKT